VRVAGRVLDLESFRIHPKHIDVPIIFITALDSSDVRKEAFELGCCAYLRKPFPGDSLMGVIRQAVSQSHPKS
jgi:DNA-binding response OmpR family regulator